MERASRRPPPPRRARATPTPEERAPAGAAAAVGEGPTALTAPEPTPAPAATPAVTARATPSRARSARTATVPVARPAGARRAEPLRLAADLPSVNLAIRVRRPLDDRLADLIHRLRQDGVRTSKVELIEMLLWELGPDPEEAVTRLARFREWAPRGAGAPLGGGERL
jgi:hypothetical protein